MLRILIPILLFFPLEPCAQTLGSMSIQVEILPSSFTLSISSSRINFGQVSRNASEVTLDPVTGERTGKAFGTHSVAGVILSGPPGSPYRVEVSVPETLMSPHGASSTPSFALQWAQSPECVSSGYASLPPALFTQGSLSGSGCARLQFGGTLTPNAPDIGVYTGIMTIQITQL